eukprot:m.97166 g.97166  ORF g.97166 m.97166 type:complete len:498 (+) comp13967_c3_seq3:1862-3355(+)
MLFKLLFLLASILGSLPSAEGQSISLTYTQQLDHFNVAEKRTFQQHYFLGSQINTSMTGPIFFYVGPESPTGVWAVSKHTFVQALWAEMLDGLLVAAEHRYFGDSLPFGNASFAPENLRWLTVEQTLADYIEIINHVASSFPTRPPVIVFGGSYGGLLSAALRIHYPGIVNASIASAAPMYQLGEVLNSTWFDLVTLTYSQTGSCGTRVAAEFASIWNARFNNTVLSKLQASLGLCTPVTGVVDVYLLLFYAKHAFSICAQFSYNHANPPTDVAESLLDVCTATATPARPLPLIYTALNLTYNGSYAAPCFNFRPASIDAPLQPPATSADDLSPDTAPSSLYHLSLHANTHARAQAARQAVNGPLSIETIPWEYLCCTQIVMPVSGTGLFSVPDNYNFTAQTQFCQKLFSVAPDPTWHRRFLLEPLRTASNIVFVNGGYDPVRGFSPPSDLAPSMLAVNVPLMGHTFDLFAPNPSDPNDVIAARESIRQIVTKWIQK